MKSVKIIQKGKGWILGAISAAVVFVGNPAAVQAEAWEFPVLTSSELRESPTTPIGEMTATYQSLPDDGATEKWNLCMLVPHLTNNILRAYLYGSVEEAKRLGVRLTTFDAGGYGNLDNQLSQFDNCVALGSDAIMLMAISPTAFAQKIDEARAAGIRVVDLNIGVEAEVDARVIVTYLEVGKIIGEALAAKHPIGSGEVSVVVMPGPAGVAWSEDTATGLKNALEGSDVVVEKVVYGAPSRLDQTPLVEDVLVTYQDLDYIVGMGTSLEAAINSLREQGRVGDIGLYGSFMTPDLSGPIEQGLVSGVVVENSITINRLATDMAVRLLQGSAEHVDAIPTVTLVNASNIADVPEHNFVPTDWETQLNVD